MQKENSVEDKKLKEIDKRIKFYTKSVQNFIYYNKYVGNR